MIQIINGCILENGKKKNHENSVLYTSPLPKTRPEVHMTLSPASCFSGASKSFCFFNQHLKKEKKKKKEGSVNDRVSDSVNDNLRVQWLGEDQRLQILTTTILLLLPCPLYKHTGNNAQTCKKSHIS